MSAPPAAETAVASSRPAPSSPPAAPSPAFDATAASDFVQLHFPTSFSAGPKDENMVSVSRSVGDLDEGVVVSAGPPRMKGDLAAQVDRALAQNGASIEGYKVESRRPAEWQGQRCVDVNGTTSASGHAMAFRSRYLLKDGIFYEFTLFRPAQGGDAEALAAIVERAELLEPSAETAAVTDAATLNGPDVTAVRRALDRYQAHRKTGKPSAGDPLSALDPLPTAETQGRFALLGAGPFIAGGSMLVVVFRAPPFHVLDVHVKDGRVVSAQLDKELEADPQARASMAQRLSGILSSDAATR
jgi:hypothetical protein